jgi:membrane protein
MIPEKTSRSDGNHPPKRRFLEDIWEIDIGSLSRVKRFGISFMRIIVLVLKGYRENDCPLHAAALTYNSLMAVVPVLALAISIMRRIGISDVAVQKIGDIAAFMPEQVRQVVFRVLDQVRNTDFSFLGIIGLALLAWIVLQVLNRMEMSFNRIWGITSPRRISRKFSDYLSVIIVVPVLLAAASAFNASLASHSVAGLIQDRVGQDFFIYIHALSILPLVATWVAFVFLYAIMTNTQISPLSAIIGGVIGGSMWFFWQQIYLKIQISIGQFNAIYAVFASIPIFLLWLYLSWQILLLGAEIVFAFQNHSTYRMEMKAPGASPQSKIMLALSIISHAAQPMLVNVPCFRISDYARLHRVPVRLINEVVAELVRAGLLVEAAGGDGRYVLLKTPSAIHVQDVFNAMLRSGSTPQSLGLERLNPAIRHVLGRIDAGAAGVLKGLNITDLLQLHARLDHASLKNEADE